MPRKSPSKRKSNLKEAYGDRIEFNNFNSTLAKLSHELFIIFKSTTANLLSFFGMGTIEIKKTLNEANSKLTSPFTEQQIEDTLKEICLFFEPEQEWYKTLVLSNGKVFMLSRKALTALARNYYTTGRFIVSALQVSTTADVLEDVSKDGSTEKLASNLDNHKIKLLLSESIGISELMIPDELVENVKQIGVKRLVKNAGYTIATSSVMSASVSEIFKSLALNKKVIKFLSQHKISLNLITLYKTLVENPLLFFETKEKLMKNLKTIAISSIKELNGLLSHLNSVIQVFNQTISYQLDNVPHKFTTEEKNLLEKYRSFINIKNRSEDTKNLHKNIFDNLIHMANFLYPVLDGTVSLLNNTTLSVLQIQQLLLAIYLVLKKNQATYDLFTNFVEGSLPTELAHVYESFINSFCNFEEVKQSIHYENKSQNECLSNRLNALFFFSILLRKKIVNLEKINLGEELKALDQPHMVTTFLPILNINFTEVIHDALIVDAGKYQRNINFTSANFFILTADVNLPAKKHPLVVVILELLYYLQTFLVQYKSSTEKFRFKVVLTGELTLATNSLSESTTFFFNIPINFDFDSQSQELIFFAKSESESTDEVKVKLTNYDECFENLSRLITTYMTAFSQILTSEDTTDEDNISSFGPRSAYESYGQGVLDSDFVRTKVSSFKTEEDKFIAYNQSIFMGSQISINVSLLHTPPISNTITLNKVAKFLYQNSIFSYTNVVLNHALNSSLQPPITELTNKASLNSHIPLYFKNLYKKFVEAFEGSEKKGYTAEDFIIITNLIKRLFKYKNTV